MMKTMNGLNYAPRVGVKITHKVVNKDNEVFFEGSYQQCIIYRRKVYELRLDYLLDIIPLETKLNEPKKIKLKFVVGKNTIQVNNNTSKISSHVVQEIEAKLSVELKTFISSPSLMLGEITIINDKIEYKIL